MEFAYNPEYIQSHATHYWFRVLSPYLEEVRISLGFCSQPALFIEEGIETRPFHLSVGRIVGA